MDGNPRKKVVPTLEQRMAADPFRSVWVTANAGSGKTHVLVDRLIRLMLADAEPETILCLTFTKAAAAEMQNRLFERLSGFTLMAEADLAEELNLLGIDTSNAKTMRLARQLFTKALETPGGLKIQTIHAFAEKLLQLFPVEAGIAPGFAVLDERQSAELVTAARHDVLWEAQRSPDSEIGQAVMQVELFATADAFEKLLRSVFNEQSHVRTLFNGSFSAVAIRAFVARAMDLDPYQSTADVEVEFSRVDRTIYRRMADAFEPVASYSRVKLSEKLKAVANAASVERVRLALSDLYLTGTLEERKKHYSKDTAVKMPAETSWFETAKSHAVELLIRHDQHVRADTTAALLVLAEAVFQRFEKAKLQAGAYDFNDLIARAKSLLRDTANAQWVLYKLDRGLTHVLVDEAQDTNPDQWAIIRAIADEFYAGAGAPQDKTRTLFVVGDRKQSIFSFQGAETSQFEKVRVAVSQLITGAGQDSPSVSLKTSYRSVPEILDFVDAVFPARALPQMGFAPSGSGDMQDDRGHVSNRSNQHGLVEFWPLMESRELDEPEVWTTPVDQQSDGAHRKLLARHIARTIRKWIGKRHIESLQRPVEAGDILILLQKRGPLFKSLIVELRMAGVPVAGADRLQLLDSLSVKDLLALGQFLILPDDDYGLACVLKSPFVPEPLNEEELFDLAHDRGKATLWARLASAESAKAKTNHAYLAHLCSTIVPMGPHILYSTVLSQCRKAMTRRLGPEARDATDAFVDIALDFEQQHGPSLASFLAWFLTGETVLKREMDKSSGQVRLMTVHGSKGLEASIVIIPDAADKEEGRSTSLVMTPDTHSYPGLPAWAISKLVPSPLIDSWKDAEREKELQERKRLLYVALTRARDELYVAGSIAQEFTERGTESLPDNCWYRFIREAIEAGSMAGKIRQVTDPCHEKQVYRLGADPRWIDSAAEVEADHSTDIPPWAQSAPAQEVMPRMESVTGYITGRRGAAPASDIPSADSQQRRQNKRGQAIHSLLQELPDFPPATRKDYARQKAKALGLEQGLSDRLADLLDLPDVQPFLGEGSQAEAEIYLQVDGAAFVGRIDRLRITEDAIYLLDYKSNREVPATVDPNHEYVQQLGFYAQALSDIYPGRRLVVGLLWTQNGQLSLLSPELLTQACERIRTSSQPAMT